MTDYSQIPLRQAASDLEKQNAPLRKSCDRAIARLKATKPKPRPKTASYDWANVDWSKTNGQIAHAIGCTSQTVREQRKRRQQ